VISPAMSRAAALAAANAHLEVDAQLAVMAAARSAATDADFAAQVADLLPGLTA
jgi:hypothetical protein